MDDLVKRLRSKNCCDATKCNCDEAADRIEAQAYSIEFAAGIICGMDPLFDKATLKRQLIDEGKSMRAALGEKKDG